VQYLSTLSNGFRELLSDGRGGILVAVAAGWFLSMGARMIYPVLLPHIRSAYGLDLTTAGLLLTVLFLLYGLGQLPGGMLADRFGERLILTLSTLVSAATLALVVTASSTPVLFLATALFGFGLALYAVARYTLLASIYPDQIGAANGVASAAADAGQSLLPPLGGLIAAVVAWQFGLAFAIPLFLCIAIAIWLMVPPRSSAETSSSGSLSKKDIQILSGELRTKAVVRGTVALLLGVCLWQAFTGFYPTYLIEIKGFSETLAGTLFGIFFLLGVLVQPLSGGAYDRFGIQKTLAVIMLLAAVGLALLPFVDHVAPLVVITIFCSSLLGFATVSQSYLISSLSDTAQGTGFGLLRTISFTVGSASPVVFGAIADRGYFDQGFMLLAVFAVTIALIAQLVPEQ